MPLITKSTRRRCCLAKAKQPAWQRGDTPETQAQRDSWKVSADNERKFAAAFGAILGSLVTPKILEDTDEAIRRGDSVDEIIAVIPYFDEGDPSTWPRWKGFAKGTEKTYESVIEGSIDLELNRLIDRLGSGAKTTKAIEDDLGFNPGEIEVDPNVLLFIRTKSLERVVSMSDREEERVRDILLHGSSIGARPDSMIDEISDTVGITVLQNQRLRRKRDAAVLGGLSRVIADKVRKDDAGRVRRSRAQTIARTETNDATTFSLTESWKRAAKEGLMPPGTRKQWVAFSDDRSSEECEDLDGDIVGLNEDFSTSAGQGFSGPRPPAHPNCRSTIVLIFP